MGPSIGLPRITLAPRRIRPYSVPVLLLRKNIGVKKASKLRLHNAIRCRMNSVMIGRESQAGARFAAEYPAVAPTPDRRHSTHLSPDRGRQRGIGSHHGLRVIRIPGQCPRRSQTLHQLVEQALIQIRHMVVLDQGQRVISTQQPHLAGVGAVVSETLIRLAGVGQFEDGGVLKVSRANKTNPYLSPVVWRTIEEAPPPLKGIHPWPADIEAVAEEGPF
jgi:hypothetical protein